jgi:GTP-binding protein Era
VSAPSQAFRSGFVSIVGRPNVGKSTLLNSLAGRKLAITSEKPQTTRNVVRAAVDVDGVQLVFVDTPGLSKPHNALGQRMSAAVRGTLRECDAVVFLVDASIPLGPGDAYIGRELARLNTPCFLGVNKVDLLSRERLLAYLGGVEKLGEFREIVPLSGLTGDGVELLRDLLARLMPEGPRYFPEGMITDQPVERLVAEIVREKALALTREEVPHSIAVVIEEMAPREGTDLLDVRAILFVERDSQKGIMVGKGGSMLREIGTRARVELEGLLGSRIFLELRVKVARDWQRDTRALDRMGF